MSLSLHDVLLGRDREKLRRLCKIIVLAQVILETDLEPLRFECRRVHWGVRCKDIKQNWTRENINCTVIITEISTNPKGSSGARMGLRRDPNFWKRGQALVPSPGQSSP